MLIILSKITMLTSANCFTYFHPGMLQDTP